MNVERKPMSRRPRWATGLATGAVGLLALTALPGDAEAARRSCRATGKFVYSFHEEVDGSFVALRTKGVNILQSDMEVVVSGYEDGGTLEDIERAKKWACSEATQCFLALATGASSCQAHYYGTVFETITKPPHFDDWRREIACNYARAGDVSGLRRTGGNTVKLMQTKIEASARRDQVSDWRYTTVRENGYVCWQAHGDPGGVHHQDPPQPRPQPQPTPPPPRPASNELRVPFQITGGSIEVIPSLKTGPCPTQIRAEASLTAAGKGTARFRLNHKGGRGPIRTVTFREGGTLKSTATYTIGEPDGGQVEGFTTQGSSGSGGIGGFQQPSAPNQHTGWFELEIVSPASPLKKTQPAHYKVVCKSAQEMEPIAARVVPGTGGGGPPDIFFLSASPDRPGGTCRLVVGNRGTQRAPRTTLRLSARGHKPVDLAVPPIPPGGRQAVMARDLANLRWLVHLDPDNAVRESDESNNRTSIQGCRLLAGR